MYYLYKEHAYKGSCATCGREVPKGGKAIRLLDRKSFTLCAECLAEMLLQYPDAQEVFDKVLTKVVSERL